MKITLGHVLRRREGCFCRGISASLRRLCHALYGGDLLRGGELIVVRGQLAAQEPLEELTHGSLCQVQLVDVRWSDGLAIQAALNDVCFLLGGLEAHVLSAAHVDVHERGRDRIELFSLACDFTRTADSLAKSNLPAAENTTDRCTGGIFLCRSHRVQDSIFIRHRNKRIILAVGHILKSTFNDALPHFLASFLTCRFQPTLEGNGAVLQLRGERFKTAADLYRSIGETVCQCKE